MERRRFGKVGGELSRRIDEAVRRARKNEEWRSEYMKELLHDDDVREEGRAEGREEGEGQLVKLINSMIAGGDGDKIALFGEPEILKAMKKKYGIN